MEPKVEVDPAKLPPWAKKVLGWVIAIALAALSGWLAKAGITPEQPPFQIPGLSVQQAPQPVFVVLGQSGSVANVEAVQASALRHPVRDRLRAKLIESAVAKGATAEQAGEALSALESERPLLDWFLRGGFLELLKLIMEIINALK